MLLTSDSFTLTRFKSRAAGIPSQISRQRIDFPVKAPFFREKRILGECSVFVAKCAIAVFPVELPAE